MLQPKLHRAQWGQAVFYAIMGLGLWLMLSASQSYLQLADAHPFILEKLPLAPRGPFLVALYAHVPSALFALAACMVLLSGPARRRLPRFHRWLGRLTGLLILSVVVPSGMYLALFAQGGWPTTVGFWLTGALTFFAMLHSILSARARDLTAHRRFSAHVTAQLSVAVISRFLLAGAETAGVYSEWVYVAALWVPVLGGAAVAELLTAPRLQTTSKGTPDEKLVTAPRLRVVR